MIISGMPKILDVMDDTFVTIDENATVADASRIMREKNICFALVTQGESKNPVGIVTEKDIIFKILAESRGAFKVTLKKIMSHPLTTLEITNSLDDVLSLMRTKNIKRLPITRVGKIVGIINLDLLFTKILKLYQNCNLNNGKNEDNIVCPYCSSKFENENEMSKHVDRVHIGAGLLEGDLRRW